MDKNRLRQLRKRAKLALTDMNTVPVIKTDKVDELVHELEVYHVELELQHNALLLTQQQLKTAYQDYESLFDFAPLTYLVVNKKGIIQKANVTATEQFGMARNRLEGEMLARLVAIEDRDEIYLHLRQVITTQQRHVIQVTCLRQDGSQFPASIESVPQIIPDHDPTIRVAISDISQRKIYEKRLETLRELDHAILGATSTTDVIQIALRYLLRMTLCDWVSILTFTQDADDTAQVQTISQWQLDTHASMVSEKPRSDIAPDLLTDKVRIVMHKEQEEMQHTILTIPILQAEGHIGSIWLCCNGKAMFNEDAVQIGEEIALQLAVAIQQMQLYQKTEKYAQHLEERVDERTRELHEREQAEHVQRIFAEAMLDITHALNSTLNLDEVLDRILANLVRITAFESANIIFWQSQRDIIIKWHKKSVIHLIGENGDEIDLNSLPVYQHIFNTGKSVVVDNVQADNVLDFPPNMRSCTYIGLPIRSDDVVHGSLSIFMPEVQPISPQHIEQLEAFAAHAAIAVNNADLHEKSHHLAVLEERQRLARDLHDAVSQNLFSLSTLAESLTGTMPDAEQEQTLNYIVNLAHGAQAEMRLLLYELRPRNFESMQIGDLLEKLVVALRGRKQISVRADIEAGLPELPLAIKTELYRITQEALNNVSKHVRSGEVDVSLKRVNGCLRLAVRDTGQGFDVDAIQNQGQGLAIMQERAENIGANLTISSTIGTGTEVEVLLPLSVIEGSE